MIAEPNTPGIMRHFVLKEPRIKQITAVQYVEKKYQEGYRDIVIAAPTGVGKSAIGSSLCFWSQDLDVEGFEPGGYYLVTQKLLQDQLQNDFKHYVIPNPMSSCQNLKSASEYPCRAFGTCGIGMKNNPRCAAVKMNACSYKMQKNRWQNAILSVTNYPYLFTEHTLVGNLPPRRVLVLDECHTLERQILGFIELSVTEETLRKWAPSIKQVPRFHGVTDFAEFVIQEYLPFVERRLETLAAWEPSNDSDADRKIAQEKLEIENHWSKIFRGSNLIKEDPENWVLNQDTNRRGEAEAVAKPLDAAPFSQDLILEMGHVRVYMSAFPGSKKIFCRSLGLDEEKVAWMNLNSTFPVENRRIYMTGVGSMSKRNRGETLPGFLSFARKILESYDDTKGIIHCNSYELGKVIYEGLKGSPSHKRLLFPESSDVRDEMFLRHKNSKEPTVILSPSMTEGFDFSYDLARWQIIAKIPYPYLGDQQVAAKKELDQDWYDLQAVMAIIQACGRIVRSDTDVGDTYILDSDFLSLWEKQQHMFPRWWTEAVVWPKRKPRE